MRERQPEPAPLPSRRRSSSMPTEMKNRPSRMSRNGRMTASIWCRYSVSASIMPDEKSAERERQAGDVRHPGRRQHHQQHRQREQLAQAAVGDLVEQRPQQPAPGRQHRDDRQHAADDRHQRSRLSCSWSSPGASAAPRARNGTKARSWNSSIANASRPWVRLSSARSVSCCSRIAVELMATAPPSTMRDQPAQAEQVRRGARTPRRCRPPAAAPSPNTSRRMASMRGSENSRPSVNSRKATPSSASSRVTPGVGDHPERVRAEHQPDRQVGDQGRQCQATHHGHQEHRAGEEDQGLRERGEHRRQVRPWPRAGATVANTVGGGLGGGAG